MPPHRRILIAGNLHEDAPTFFARLLERYKKQSGPPHDGVTIALRRMSGVDALLLEFSEPPSVALTAELAALCARQSQRTAWAWFDQDFPRSGKPYSGEMLRFDANGLEMTYPYLAAKLLKTSVFALSALPAVCAAPADAEGLREYLAKPPRLPREKSCVLGGWMLPNATHEHVARAAAILSSYLTERGLSTTNRELRVSTVAGLDVLNLELCCELDDPWQAERPFIDRAPDLGRALADQLQTEVLAWSSGLWGRFMHERPSTVVQFLPHTEPAAGIPIEQPLKVLSQRFGMTTKLELWELGLTAAIVLPLSPSVTVDADVDHRALSAYLANPPPSVAKADPRYEPTLHFMLPRWMIFEAATLAKKRGISVADLLILAWNLGKESVYKRSGFRSEIPDIRAGVAPIPEPADDERIPVLLPCPWSMHDAIFEDSSDFSIEESPVAAAYRAARPALFAD